MTLQLRAVAIYSKQGRVREVTFQPGRLNVITGGSNTGKSALLDIVDYCWGRDECTIPRGRIRRSASWYAILLDRSGESIVVARRNPEGNAKVSEDVYVDRVASGLPDSADVFFRNASPTSLRIQLSELLGISENLSRPEAGSTRRPLEASASQAILFCLQFQYEVANPRMLFHRQGEEYMASAIRDGLAYFLGATGEDQFLAQKRHDDARQRLRRLERELADARALASAATDTALALLSEARRHGIVPPDARAEGVAEVRAILAQAAGSALVPSESPDEPSADLADLETRRRNIRAALQDVREELADLDRLVREATAFEAEATEQFARLSSIGLVPDGPVRGHVCPLCENVLPTPVPSLDELQASLLGLDAQLRSVRRDQPRVQARRAALESRRSAFEGDLRDVQAEIGRRTSENERLRLEQARFSERARVLGRIGYYLENVRAIEEDDGLRIEVARARAEVQELERTVDRGAIEERVATALGLVGARLTGYATALGLEHGENALRLDRRNLTVVADTMGGPLPLTQIGSGQNWVGYHLAAHMALHAVFRGRRRPVPAFLMIDQPSQAHYPRDRDPGSITGSDDEDQRAVARLYEVLNGFVTSCDGAMQVIVVDHVELLQPWFQDRVVQRWRDGAALVPDDWEE